MNGTALTADDEMVVVGAPLPRIESVEFVDGFQVRIGWKEGKRAGQIEVVDLAPALFNHRLFAPLRGDPDLFSRVFVEHWGSALSWPGRDMELSAEWIDRLPRTAMSNDDFRQAMDTMRMTLDGMAVTLGIARRSIAQYRKDKPIPRYLALAVRQLQQEVSK